MELQVEDLKREDIWSLGENFLSEPGSALKEPVKIWEKNRKNWDSYKVLMIVLAEIFGGDLRCGRKSMVGVSLDQGRRY